MGVYFSRYIGNIKLTNIYQDRQPLRHNILFNQKMRKASQNSRICGKMTATEQEKQSFLTLCRHLLQFFKHNLCLGIDLSVLSECSHIVGTTVHSVSALNAESFTPRRLVLVVYGYAPDPLAVKGKEV